MTTQPLSPRNQVEAEWRVLAEEAAQEKDPTKLMEIVDALNSALDEEEKRHPK